MVRNEARAALLGDTTRRLALRAEHRSLLVTGYTDRDACRYLAQREHVSISTLVVAIQLAY